MLTKLRKERVIYRYELFIFDMTNVRADKSMNEKSTCTHVARIHHQWIDHLLFTLDLCGDLRADDAKNRLIINFIPADYQPGV